MKKGIVILIMIIFIIPMWANESYGKDKKVGYSKEFYKKAELKKKQIKKNRKMISFKKNQPLELTVTGAVIGKQLHTSALGYRIKPGECAVSQDLIDVLGKDLTIGEPVGKYKKSKLAPVGQVKVSCVMPSKWKRRIDVYVNSKAVAFSITGKRVVKML